MTKGRSSKNYPPPRLVVPRKEAFRKIKRQIDTGHEIKNQRIFSMMDLETARERRTEWVEDNTQMLSRLLSNPSFAEEYRMGVSSDMDTGMTLEGTGQQFRQDINEQIRTLESLVERMKLLPDPQTQEAAEPQLQEKPVVEELLEEEEIREVKSGEEPPRKKAPKEEPPREVPQKREPLKKEPPSAVVPNQRQSSGANILLIHGRDEAVKESVVRFIEKMGLRATILHEQPDEGTNIIEKFGERSQITFALILMTPDDIAAPRDNPKEGKVRVSQNVAFEFGYCVGKLGHKRVCALCTEGVEIPWDYPGAVYVPMDPRGGWRLLVAKEMKQAGVEIDLNKAI
ncbi:MAG: hypothetical protein A2162_12255 [Deltaproteobacteria bacterium RBG_13_52_11b]|nr:MAG: hypothetical protein A2162_12255 [Deltaproteobacteria bacterium RBG_13_52_11b]